MRRGSSSSLEVVIHRTITETFSWLFPKAADYNDVDKDDDDNNKDDDDDYDDDDDRKKLLSRFEAVGEKSALSPKSIF